jgi:hypothetical protein
VFTDFNRDLLNPIGSQLDSARKVITEFTALLADRQFDELELVINGIEPEPQNPDAASGAGIIGTCLRSLDAWLSDPEVQQAFQNPVRVAHLPASDRLAKGILATAKRGAALASIGPLLDTHGGELVLVAALTASAWTILSVDEVRGPNLAVTVRDMFDAVPDEEAPGEAS